MRYRVRSTARSVVARGRDQGRDKKAAGLGEIRSTGNEVVRLVVDYIKQETLDPLKGLGRYVLFGVVGAVALAIGLVILAVGPPAAAPGGDRTAPSTGTGRGPRT